METKVFRGNARQRLLFGVLWLPLLLLNHLPSLPEKTIALFRSPGQVLQGMSFLDWTFFLISVATWGVVFGLLAYIYWMYRQLTLTVNETGLVFNNPQSFLLKFFINPYHVWPRGAIVLFADIVEITVSEWWNPGNLVLQTRSGKFSVPVADLAYSRELVELIISRASHAKIDNKARAMMKRNHWGWAYALAVAAYFLFAILPNVIVTSVKSNIWREEPSVGYIGAYSLDSDGSVWTVLNRGHGNERELTVWKQGPGGWNNSNIPSLRCENCWVLQVGHDQVGNPYIVHVKDDNNALVYTWDGTDWRSWQVAGRFTVSSRGNSGYDGVVWAHDDTALLRLNSPSRSVERFELPVDVLQKDGTIWRHQSNTDGSVFVFLHRNNKEEAGSIYLFQDEKWQEKIIVPEGESIPQITLDSMGNPWAIFGTMSDSVYRLGKYSFADQEWQYYELRSTESFPVEYYNAIQSDRQGRIWLTGSYETGYAEHLGFVRVVMPGDSGLSTVVEYSAKNSNGTGEGLMLFRDGRILRVSDRLLWIDASAETLPQPLPAWATWADGSLQGFLMRILPALGLPVLGVVLLFIWLLQKFLESRTD